MGKKKQKTPTGKKHEVRKPTNDEVEMRWIEAWSELFELVGERRNVRCLLPDGVVVDVEGSKGWLQDSVYAGYQVKVGPGYVLGRPGVILFRSKGEPPFENAVESDGAK
jgi:hypothetical protein